MRMCYVLKRAARKKHCFAQAGHEQCPRNTKEQLVNDDAFALMRPTRWVIGNAGAYLFDGRRYHQIFPFVTSSGGYNTQ